MLIHATQENASPSEEVIRCIIDTEAYLSGLKNKAPQDALNEKLSYLVGMVRPVYNDLIVESVLSDLEVSNRLTSLRSSLSTCEYELEKHWAEKIIANQAHYTDYPYIDSYRALVESEISLLNSQAQLSNQKICFIGSGPMSISAFEMMEQYPDLDVHCVDMSNEAINLSDAVCKASGFSMQHVNAYAQDFDYSDFDIVIIASMTLGKENVLEQIKNTAKNGTIVIIRSVEGLRNVLYCAVTNAEIPSGFSYLKKSDYRPEQINTTLLYCLNKETAQ